MKVAPFSGILYIAAMKEEYEIPLDIYPSLDVLGMERPAWQKVETEESDPTPVEPVRFTQKEVYLIVLICGGFLYFSSLGVWLTNREVVSKNVPVSSQKAGFVPVDLAPVEVAPAAEMPAPEWSMESHQAFIEAYGDQARISAIDAQVAKRYDTWYRLQEQEQFKNQVQPPPNWALLRGNWTSIPFSNH